MTQKLPIIEKFTVTSPEITPTVRRLGTPQIIQPTYIFDVSDLYGYFIPEVSFNDVDFYWRGDHYFDVSTIDARNYFYTGAEVDTLIANISTGYTKSEVDTLIANNSTGFWRTYTDSSLSLRDTSINWLNSNTWKLATPLIKESSLGPDFSWSGGLLNMDFSVDEFATNASVGLALTKYAKLSGDRFTGDVSIVGELTIDATLHTSFMNFDTSRGVKKWVIGYDGRPGENFGFKINEFVSGNLVPKLVVNTHDFYLNMQYVYFGSVEIDFGNASLITGADYGVTSSSFTTADGKTVTVKNGLIISIV